MRSCLETRIDDGRDSVLWSLQMCLGGVLGANHNLNTIKKKYCTGVEDLMQQPIGVQ